MTDCNGSPVATSDKESETKEVLLSLYYIDITYKKRNNYETIIYLYVALPIMSKKLGRTSA